jgi:hypothetical protein
MRLIHLAHELEHGLLMLVDMQGEVDLVVTHPLEFSTNATTDRTVRTLFYHVQPVGRCGDKLVAPDVATGHKVMRGGKMVIKIILVYGTRAHGALPVKNTRLDVLLRVDDAVLRTTRARGHSVKTVILHVMVKAILGPREPTPGPRMKTRVVDPLVHGHVGIVLFVGLVGASKLPRIPYCRTKKALDFFFPLAIRLVESDVLPGAQDADTVDGMTPRAPTGLRTRQEFGLVKHRDADFVVAKEAHFFLHGICGGGESGCWDFHQYVRPETEW